MKIIVASVVFATSVGALTIDSMYPVYSPGAGSVDTCSGISCKPLDCKPPFEYQAPEKTGTCCPLCLAKDIKVPEDRSWAKGMGGGIGMNNNADPTLCRDVVCPKPDCPEFDQFFDGRCCTKCPTSKMTTSADLAAGFKPEPKLP